MSKEKKPKFRKKAPNVTYDRVETVHDGQIEVNYVPARVIAEFKNPEKPVEDKPLKLPFFLSSRMVGVSPKGEIEYRTFYSKANGEELPFKDIEDIIKESIAQCVGRVQRGNCPKCEKNNE